MYSPVTNGLRRSKLVKAAPGASARSSPDAVRPSARQFVTTIHASGFITPAFVAPTKVGISPGRSAARPRDLDLDQLLPFVFLKPVRAGEARESREP